MLSVDNSVSPSPLFFLHFLTRCISFYIGGTNHHPGNKQFRSLADGRRQDYRSAPRHEKLLVAKELVAHWRAIGGRFIAFDEASGLWSDVGDAKACSKTGQLLREKEKHGESSYSKKRRLAAEAALREEAIRLGKDPNNLPPVILIDGRRREAKMLQKQAQPEAVTQTLAVLEEKRKQMEQEGSLCKSTSKRKSGKKSATARQVLDATGLLLATPPISNRKVVFKPVPVAPATIVPTVTSAVKPAPTPQAVPVASVKSAPIPRATSVPITSSLEHIPHATSVSLTGSVKPAPCEIKLPSLAATLPTAAATACDRSSCMDDQSIANSSNSSNTGLLTVADLEAEAAKNPNATVDQETLVPSEHFLENQIARQWQHNNKQLKDTWLCDNNDSTTATATAWPLHLKATCDDNKEDSKVFVDETDLIKKDCWPDDIPMEISAIIEDAIPLNLVSAVLLPECSTAEVDIDKQSWKHDSVGTISLPPPRRLSECECGSLTSSACAVATTSNENAGTATAPLPCAVAVPDAAEPFADATVVEVLPDDANESLATKQEDDRSDYLMDDTSFSATQLKPKAANKSARPSWERSCSLEAAFDSDYSSEGGGDIESVSSVAVPADNHKHESAFFQIADYCLDEDVGAISGIMEKTLLCDEEDSTAAVPMVQSERQAQQQHDSRASGNIDGHASFFQIADFTFDDDIGAISGVLEKTILNDDDAAASAVPMVQPEPMSRATSCAELSTTTAIPEAAAFWGDDDEAIATAIWDDEVPRVTTADSAPIVNALDSFVDSTFNNEDKEENVNENNSDASAPLVHNVIGM